MTDQTSPHALPNMTENQFTRRRTLALTAGAITTGLAGCLARAEETQTETQETTVSTADDHDHETDNELGHPEEYVEVAMQSDAEGHHFVPHLVHLEPGGTVSWVLENGVHDTVAYHPSNADLLPSSSAQRIPEDATPWASNVLARSEERFEVTFPTEGVYDYVCTIGGHGPHHGGWYGPDGRGYGPWEDEDEYGPFYPDGSGSCHVQPGTRTAGSAGSLQPEDSRWFESGGAPGGIGGRGGRRGAAPHMGGMYGGGMGGRGMRGFGGGQRDPRWNDDVAYGSRGEYGPSPSYGTHEASGMVGRIIVGDPNLDPDEQPALRPPDEHLPEAARVQLRSFNERTLAALDDGSN